MKVLLATDGSEFSDAAVEKCAQMVLRPNESEIKVLSVYERLRPMSGEPFGVSNEYYLEAENASKKLASDAVDKACETLAMLLPDVSLSRAVEPGRAARIIVETAEEWSADVIVMGSHGRGFWARNLIGSVTDGVVHHAPCSVLIVRKPESAE